MAGVGFTNKAAFFQDFQSAVDRDKADTGLFSLNPLVNCGWGLVLVRIKNFVDYGTTLRSYFVAMTAQSTFNCLEGITHANT